MNKWYKYQDRIINLSLFDEFKVMEVTGETFEIHCYINGQMKDWFKYPSKEEARAELNKIYNILSIHNYECHIKNI